MDEQSNEVVIEQRDDVFVVVDNGMDHKTYADYYDAECEAWLVAYGDAVPQFMNRRGDIWSLNDPGFHPQEWV